MERRYLQFGRVAHVVNTYGYGDADWISVCGADPGVFDWLGTGSQEEHEKAAAMPRCQKCCQKMANWRW